MLIRFRYHLAFDINAGPDEETVEFKTIQELEKMLNHFPTLVLRDNIIFKKFPEGNIAVGQILKDQGGHLSKLTAD